MHKGAENLKPFKRIGLKTDEKLGTTTFSVKLPISYEKKLKSLPKEEKIKLMRSAIMDALDKLDDD